MTVHAWLTRAATQLKAAGLRDARLEAAFLLSPVTKQTVPSLLLHRELPLTPIQQKRADQFLNQRRRRVPLAYIEGTQPFLDFELKVTRDVLIPRPETEQLVLLAAERLSAKMPTPKAPLPSPQGRGVTLEAVIADVGTGSGCIAIGLARKLSLAQLIAIDLSTNALRIAKSNAKRLDVHNRCTFVKGNLCAPLAAKRLRVDALLANLPYVSTAEMTRLQPELRLEPRLAFEAGRDGLDLIRKLLRQAPAVMKDNGWIGLEVGHRQAQRVAAIMKDGGWKDVQIHPDFSGIERLVEGRLIRGTSWTF